ncbi:right-handed parallel beta-helix repeat-containing protein [Listeria weihenstephanensis]|uniref:Right-handed parallel beta-helix repeat-containing protein n=1 Tax=Listeria weihenstephanensis TaxID=1006155 RepID=A0A841ZC88_9LIST|nr:right-handed parallel beta-helix repeat-containing protein [Listeria weihenstephanensis]MBC1502107.1 right-handed parallel beta-helix repeat-containing protein [Listeria weihenstephanensis]
MSKLIVTTPLTSLSELSGYTTIQAHSTEDLGWLDALVKITAPKNNTGAYIPLKNITIENVVFDLNKHSHFGLKLTGCQQVTIRNCIFRNYAFDSRFVGSHETNDSALYFSECQQVTVEGCHFINLDPGAPLDPGSNGDVYAAHQLNRCITIEGYTSSNFTIRNNHFGPSPAGVSKPDILSQEEWALDQTKPIVQGITCVGYDLKESDFIISGNTFHNVLDNGLYLTACHGATIKDNTFHTIEEAIVLYGSTDTTDETKATGSFTIQENRFQNITNNVLAIGGNIDNGRNFRYTKKIDFRENIVDQKHQRDASLPAEKGVPIFFRTPPLVQGKPQAYKVLEFYVKKNTFSSLNRAFHVFHLGNIGLFQFEYNQFDGDLTVDPRRAFFFCRTNQPFAAGSTVRKNQIRKKKDRYTHQPMLPFAIHVELLTDVTPADILKNVRPSETFATYYPLHEGDTLFQWNEWDALKWRSLYLGTTSLSPYQVHAERYEAPLATPLQAGQSIRYFSTYAPLSGMPAFYTEEYVAKVYAKGLEVQDYTWGQDWVYGKWLRTEAVNTIRLVIDGQPTQEVAVIQDANGTAQFQYYIKGKVTVHTEDVRMQALGKKANATDEEVILDEIRIPILQSQLVSSRSYHIEDMSILVHTSENRQLVHALHSVVDGKCVRSTVLYADTSFYYPVPSGMTRQKKWVIEARDIYGDLIAKWVPPVSTAEVWTDIPSYSLDAKSVIQIGYYGGKMQSTQILVNQVVVATVSTASLTQTPGQSSLTLYLQKYVQTVSDQVQLIALDADNQPIDSVDIPVLYSGLVLTSARQQSNPAQIIIEGRLDLTLVPATAFARPKDVSDLSQWGQAFQANAEVRTLLIRVLKMERQLEATGEVYIFTLQAEDPTALLTVPTQLHICLQQKQGYPLMSAETPVYTSILKEIRPFKTPKDSYITGIFDPTIRARFSGKIALQLRVDGALQGNPAYWDTTKMDWQHFAKGLIVYSYQRVELIAYHGSTIIDVQPVPLYVSSIKDVSRVQLGKTQSLKITLEVSAEPMTTLTLYRNGSSHSGASGYANSASEEKQVTFYVNATDFALGDVLTLRAYVSGRMLDEFRLQVEVPIFQSAVFLIGGNEVTGMYQLHAKPEWQLKLLALQINGEMLSKVPPVTDANFKYYAKGKILETSIVHVCGYNANGQLLQMYPVGLI